MQLANVLVALNGDTRNTVPKQVTPPEAVVLMAIHGEGSVFDIEPLDDEVERSNSEELERLFATYHGKNDANEPFVKVVFPGRGVPLPQDFEDLNLDESLYRPTEREKPKPKKGRATKASGSKAAASKSDDPMA